ncbi:class I SAM-dependent methyltransferase [Micromonospora sp. NPDC047548]|uniref:class I SAM-dependent methyltransferase n=1 Tax=Micromonospora sp. NPDC047548 TaxID=3155624 RepID=UPI003403A94F
MRARVRVNVPGAELVEGDLRRLPVPDGDVDLVVCGLALAHVPDLIGVMGEFARVLRPGAHLVVSDIHVLLLYLGGVAHAVGPERPAPRVPAAGQRLPDRRAPGRFCIGAVRRAALAGQRARRRTPGPPVVPEASDAAYTATPAVIVWHFTREH